MSARNEIRLKDPRWDTVWKLIIDVQVRLARAEVIQRMLAGEAEDIHHRLWRGFFRGLDAEMVDDRKLVELLREALDDANAVAGRAARLAELEGDGRMGELLDGELEEILGGEGQ